jgi:TM2 domain-containing membrane protein YozV
MSYDYEKRARIELDREHNVMAAALSLVLPGLGHIYKARYGTGLAILLLGVPLSLWVGVLLSLATLGLGLMIPVCFWAMVSFCAFYSEDRRKHHVMNVF